jgi:dTDP-4-amino-4,6-dideoxygalactose transaminase
LTEVLTQTVPFFNYAVMFKAREAEFIQTFRDVGCRGGFILQHELTAFEQHLAEFLGARHAIGVGNATDGLNFLLRAADIGAGDEVIISTHTMIATSAAIHFVGAVAVPVECGPDHLIDPASVKEAVTSRTRAIMPTQLNGRTCDMDALQAVADEHKLLIIEDAAQGLGSRFKGRYAGTFGFGSAISFYPAKVLGCLGDGGAVITDDDIVCEKIRQLRDHGRDSNGEIRSWGLNSRLDNLQAAFLDLQFHDYEYVMTRRRYLASLYTERLGSLREVVLPPAPDSDSAHFDIYQNYEIEAERRDELKLYLKDHGIGTLIQWGGQAVHTLKALNFSQHLPYSESLFTRLLMLPMNMSLSDSDVHYVCDTIRNFYGR